PDAGIRRDLDRAVEALTWRGRRWSVGSGHGSDSTACRGDGSHHRRNARAETRHTGVAAVTHVRTTLPTSTNGANLRPMIGAVIYVRVSTREQTENLSLPIQLRVCEEYCRRQGYEILERFREEGESAKTTDRTELQKLLKYCREHKGKVNLGVVYTLTRFARDKDDH